MKFTQKIVSAVLGFALVTGMAATLPAFSTPAYAQTGAAKSMVDQAKMDGLVGERIDGYLGLVRGGVSAEIQSAVNEINIRRKSAYTKLARDQGVEIAVIARLTGEKLVAKAYAGQMTMGADGVWNRK